MDVGSVCQNGLETLFPQAPACTDFSTAVIACFKNTWFSYSRRGKHESGCLATQELDFGLVS